MIPATDADHRLLTFQPPDMPSGTFFLDRERRRVRGRTDQREAVRQAVYLILHTERYACPIYSWNYGAELFGLVGRPIPFVLPEIKRRVTEALLQDDRITGVSGWEFDVRRGTVTAAFTVHTVWGDFNADAEVRV